MTSFSLDLAKYAEARKASMGEVVREVVLTVAASVDMRSPVGDRDRWSSDFVAVANRLGWIKDSGKGYIGGHFRANNQYRFGAPEKGEVVGVDQTGGATMAKIRAGVMSAPIAGMHYIANNVPYAMALENGHSDQAPHGVYELAAIDVATAARAIIARKFQ